MKKEIIISGFGGQGGLAIGKNLAEAGMDEGLNVTWAPSYGPEMRGGTANCSVILSDEPIGSPIVAEPDILVAMNLPSLDKYESAVKPGGTIFTDSDLVERNVSRTDVKVFCIPATTLARGMGAPTLANMIITGKLIRETGAVSFDGMEKALQRVVSARHKDLFETNLKALKIGYEL